LDEERGEVARLRRVIFGSDTLAFARTESEWVALMTRAELAEVRSCCQTCLGWESLGLGGLLIRTCGAMAHGIGWWGLQRCLLQRTAAAEAAEAEADGLRRSLAAASDDATRALARMRQLEAAAVRARVPCASIRIVNRDSLGVIGMCLS
jgi:hypothetical protein